MNRLKLYLCLMTLSLMLATFAMAQPHDSSHEPSAHHHDAPAAAGQWDGSPEGVAYSEFNHHLAGVFVLLIGLSELRGGLGVTMLAWSRFLLPLAMLGAGGFLIIWSDHEAWPIGYKSFAETYFSDDWETVQHKLYAILLLSVGAIEMLRRTDRVKHFAWGMPLPVFALIGGVMLFLHSHGAHPAAHKIAIHHAVMGTTALVAGLCKITAGIKRQEGRSPWGIAWAVLVLLIGVELLFYTE
jgi:putative copper resistance protein D